MTGQLAQRAHLDLDDLSAGGMEAMVEILEVDRHVHQRQARPLYLDLAMLMEVAEAVYDGEVAVRDYGLLASALARPQSTVFGQDAYPTVKLKAAALLHSPCTNHARVDVDGNKRVAVGATIVFLDINDAFHGQSIDELFDLTMAVAGGSLAEVTKIADRLA